MEVEQIKIQSGADLDQLVLSDFEKFSDGSGYKCWVAMSAGGFSCNRRFWFDSLDSTIKALEEMDRGIPGEAVLGQQFEHEMLTFTMNRQGHVVVQGDFFQYGELGQSAKIAFRTDQTVLKYLIRDLKKLNSEKPKSI